MTDSLRTRHLSVALGISAVLVAAGGSIAVASSSSTSTTNRIHACVDTSTGTIRIVKHFPCKSGESKLSWNKRGPRGYTGPRGPRGPRGATGATGAPGAAGATVLNGTGAPAADLGKPGDFYVDTNAWTIYGPKTANGWPATGHALQGPAGPPGATGASGSGSGTTEVDVVRAGSISLPNGGGYQTVATYDLEAGAQYLVHAKAYVHRNASDLDVQCQLGVAATGDVHPDFTSVHLTGSPSGEETGTTVMLTNDYDTRALTSSYPVNFQCESETSSDDPTNATADYVVLDITKVDELDDTPDYTGNTTNTPA